MTRLEQRYRRLLLLLPASYRAAWEEDMVATFLSSVHTHDPEDDDYDADYIDDFGRPGWSEVASIAVLAVQLRIGTAGAPPRYAAFGACLVLFSGHMWLLGRSALPLPPLDWAGLLCATIVAVTAVHLVRQARTRFGRFSVWTPTLAIIAFAVLGQRLMSLLDYGRSSAGGWHPATVTLGIAEAIAVASATIVLVLLSAHALRRLPATPPGTAAAWSTPTR